MRQSPYYESSEKEICSPFGSGDRRRLHDLDRILDHDVEANACTPLQGRSQ